MIDIRDIRKARLKELETREQSKNVIPATIIERNGSVNPPNLPNYVWVRDFNQPEGGQGIAFNDQVDAVDGLNVLVGDDPKVMYGRVVIGLYHGGIFEGEDSILSYFNVPIHGQKHQMPSEDNLGSDPVKIYQPAIQILKTTGNGTSLIVTTQSYIYNHGHIRYYFPGQLTDLTSNIPGAGLIRRVLLYLDPDTNTIQALNGTAVLNNGIIPIPFPTIPDGMIPSAYVKLANGQTSISTVLHIDDTRDFLNDGSDGYDANREGEFLFSLDGIRFTPQIPVSTKFGIVLNSEGLVVVI